MATYAQRTVSIADAVFNKASTLAEQTLLVSTVCPNLPAEWTQAQKAEAFIHELIRLLRSMRSEQIKQPSIDSATSAATTQAASEIPDL